MVQGWDLEPKRFFDFYLGSDMTGCNMEFGDDILS